MAGRGPAPKDPSQLHRRNALPPVTELEVDGQLRGPDLPDRDWPQETRDWWEGWRTSAQAATFIKTDWKFLLDTAMLHAEFWRGHFEYAAELRLRAAKFGATPEDRMRMRLEVTDPSLPPKRVRPARDNSNREARLMRAVGE
jgi:hypothetical protein